CFDQADDHTRALLLIVDAPGEDTSDVLIDGDVCARCMRVGQARPQSREGCDRPDDCTSCQLAHWTAPYTVWYTLYGTQYRAVNSWYASPSADESRSARSQSWSPRRRPPAPS